MVEPEVRKSLVVLSSRETRSWHSPFSKELRESRQSWIVERCRSSAERSGFTEYAIYDAFETLVAWGTLTAK